MELKTELYNNKTLRYIYPQLSLYGKTFYSELFNHKLNLTGVFLMDCIYKKVKNLDKHYCFLVFNNCGKFNHTKKRYESISDGRHSFKQFLNYARNHKAFLDDYVLNFKEPLHIVIFEFPKETEKSVDWFLKGKYSKMYTKEQVAACKFEKGGDRMDALLPKEIIKERFVEKMNKKYGTTLGLNDFSEITENEIPPILSEEYLNYSK